MPYNYAPRFNYPKSYSVKFTGEADPEYRTHHSKLAQRLHKASWIALWPARLTTQFLARAIEPAPGANKDKWLRKTAIRTGAGVGALVLLPLMLPSLILGFGLRLAEHRYRPVISYYENPHADKPAKPEMSKEKPLHIRTHNVGLVPSTMSTVGDLRDPNTRAREIIKSIIEDKNQPDVICFQETFHEDATRILCEGLSTTYPYILHNVAPHISSFSSGGTIVSKYPLKDIQFDFFDGMVSPDKIAPRGIVKACIATEKGDVAIYNIHTQSFLSEARANARKLQLKAVHKLMKKDAQEAQEKGKKIHQVVMGDFNTSMITAWGESNVTPAGQAEQEVLQTMNKYFSDPFLRDHSNEDGKRTKKEARFLKDDNEAMGTELNEPQATWYRGPFAKRGLIINITHKFDLWWHNRPKPTLVVDNKDKVTWGTPAWRRTQPLSPAKFDFILFPKKDKPKSDKAATIEEGDGKGEIKGRIEIRNIKVPENAESSHSDHAATDGMLYVK